MRRRLLVAMATAVGLTACESPTLARPAFAYNPTQLTAGQLYRWPSGSVIKVHVPVQPAGSTLDLLAATSRALGAWNLLPLFGEYRLELGTLAEAQVIVVDRAAPLPVAPVATCPFSTGNASGATYFCPVNGRAARLALAGGTASNVSVVVSVDVARLASQGRVDAVVAHELGHALGLGGHSDDPTDLMFAAPSVTRPSNRDAQTLQYVLGQRAAFLL